MLLDILVKVLSPDPLAAITILILVFAGAFVLMHVWADSSDENTQNDETNWTVRLLAIFWLLLCLGVAGGWGWLLIVAP